jgi:uncharacterized protein YndB with AHSA1/START domain
MKPITASVTVPQPREQVYDYLDVLANHEAFTDHMLVEWQLSGPQRGVGACARFRLKKPGRADWMDLKVIAAEAPHGTTEETVSARGRRRTRGTYTLDELASGGTRITFELAWIEAPALERLGAPLTRAVARRGNQRAMERLAERLDQRL